MLRPMGSSSLPSLPAGAGTALASPDTQATAVHRRLREDILAGRLPPGMRLKVHDLAATYGAGPGPLREALAQLAAEGLARRIEQRGFRVAEAGPEELAGLIRTRCLVECLALRESIAHGGPAWEDAVVAAEHRLARLPRSLEPDRFVANPAWEAAHRVFHAALLDACGAPPLLAFCERLREDSDRYRALASSVAYPGRDVAAEHAAIARAALDRDADRAAELLAAHLNSTGDFLSVAIARGGSASRKPSRRRTRE
jgi:DNA-binding GntR family transcriptional regulator